MGAADPFVLREHLECVPVRDMFYCPLNMWAHEALPEEEQRAALVADLQQAVEAIGKVFE